MLSLAMFLLFGLLVGAIARLLMGGRDGGGWVFSICLGIAGAFVGGFVGRLFGIYSANEPTGFIMSVVGAMLLVALYHGIRRTTRNA